ncbi:MAG: glutamate 5-kinase [Alphaproteobacteria bacterium]|nr:glutamate 5-kinase [Alphaproteobacteria bacterium]
MSSILPIVDAAKRLSSARRVVIKIGSALLIDSKRNAIREEWMECFIADVVECKKRGQEVVLVSSGSVALGRRVLRFPARPLRLEETQAAAACGQIRLAHIYQEALAKKGQIVAQILLTPADTEERQSYLNIRATLRNLLSLGIIPVINENDTVTTPTNRYGDNDRLAARVATMIEADCVVLLSDIDGLYSADPGIDPAARFIPEVHALTSEIFDMAGDSRSGFGRGGMRTKIEAARMALNGGCALVISHGDVLRPLKQIEQNCRCTWFIPDCSPAAARKTWIAGSLNPRGALTIDEGACQALKKGRSLLSVGVKKVEGEFNRGDAVTVLSLKDEELARGLVAYNSAEAQKIMGCRSGKIESILGYTGREEMIHRDDLAML